jgi:glutathione S-transferase
MVPRLITIPFSHFCEKARWSLDAAGVAYREEGHVPGLHRRAVRTLKRTTSVPVLVLNDGTVLGDSPLIVHYADARASAARKILPPVGSARDEALALERRFDHDLGPHVRRFAYFHLLPHRALVLRLFDRQTPRGERLVVRAAFPLIRRLMRRFMSIDEPRSLESRDRMRRVFDDVGARLADGRPYLMGDAFGAADIAFASLASPMLLPEEHPISPPSIDDLPIALADEIRATRQTPAGKFVLRIYKGRKGGAPLLERFP